VSRSFQFATFPWKIPIDAVQGGWKSQVTARSKPLPNIKESPCSKVTKQTEPPSSDLLSRSRAETTRTARLECVIATLTRKHGANTSLAC
jgi:predicted signal transduction protein with EAL and GGDEF domain